MKRMKFSLVMLIFEEINGNCRQYTENNICADENVLVRGLKKILYYIHISEISNLLEIQLEKNELDSLSLKGNFFSASRRNALYIFCGKYNDNAFRREKV